MVTGSRKSWQPAARPSTYPGSATCWASGLSRAAAILADRKLYAADDHADYGSVDSLIGGVIQSFQNRRKLGRDPSHDGLDQG
jgi:hypothetical protein